MNNRLDILMPLLQKAILRFYFVLQKLGLFHNLQNYIDRKRINHNLGFLHIELIFDPFPVLFLFADSRCVKGERLFLLILYRSLFFPGTRWYAEIKAFSVLGII